MIAGVSPSKGLGIGCRWGLGLVECEIHLRTLPPTVCADRLVNRGVRVREGTGGEGRGWQRKEQSSPKGWMGTAEGSRRRIREPKPPSDDLIQEFKMSDRPQEHKYTSVPERCRWLLLREPAHRVHW